jgi:predicted dehydrogenase
LRAIRDAARNRGLTVRVGFNHRFHPGVQRLHQLLTERDGGPLLYVRARYGHGGRLGYEQEWRADPALSGGGELLDQGIHLIDLTRYLAGDVDLAFAELTSAFWPMPVEDNAFLCLRVRGGGTAWLHASWTEWKNLFSFELTQRDRKFEIAGLGGSYGVERLTLYEMRPTMGPPDTTAWEWPAGDDSWAVELADVIAAVNGAPGVAATIDDAIAALEIVEEAYQR